MIVIIIILLFSKEYGKKGLRIGLVAEAAFMDTKMTTPREECYGLFL